MRQFWLFFLSCGLFFTLSTLSAADPQTEATDATDADFELQGEYRGDIDGNPYGLQVIAMGSGAFETAVYRGGLPGAGAIGKPIARISGSRDGDTVEFLLDVTIQKEQTLTKTNSAGERIAETMTVSEALKFTLVLTSGSVTATNADGVVVGTLSRVNRQSPTIGVAPPWGATKLFDGNSAWHFKGGKITDDGLLMEGTELKTAYRDFMLHLEFRLPYMPEARGQGRANSGVYLQSRYEVQILDSFGLDGEFNECGALYRYQPPNLNMCLPPLVWQTYDIEFRAAKFDAQGTKTKNAVLTVWQNGVKIHDKFELDHKTGAGQQEGPNSIVTKLQNHNNPVRFRNIWILDYQAPLPDPLAHPEFLSWSPDLFAEGAFHGMPHPLPVSGPHINIHGNIR